MSYEPDWYDTHCPTCDAPEPHHTPTCAVPQSHGQADTDTHWANGMPRLLTPEAYVRMSRQPHGQESTDA